MRKDTRPFYMLFFIGMIPLIMAIGNSMFIPLLPQMQYDLMLTTVESGWLLTSFSIPAALFVPIGGFLSDRFGRKRVALLGLETIAIGCFIAAVANMLFIDVFPFLLVGRVIQGLGAGTVTPLAMTMVSDLYQGEQRTRALGSMEVFNGIGKAISPVIGGVILGVSWTISFVLLLAISVVAMTGIMMFIKEQVEDLPEMGQTIDRKVQLMTEFKLQWRWLVPIFLSGGIGMLLLFGFLFYLSFLVEEVNITHSFVKGFILSLPLLGLTIISYLTGRYLKGNEDSYKRIMVYSICVMIVGVGSLLLGDRLALIIIGLMIYGCGFGSFLPAANAALASIITPYLRGRIFSFYAMFRFLGVAFGPLIFGFWVGDVLQMVYNALFLLCINGVIMLYSWPCLPIGKPCGQENFSHI